ncbi:MAG: hypothetical protein LBM60_02610 [Clostridium sp.]|jgi:hypothetical protein|nr:hypothetical protein [Clostridium sp.]
MGFAATQMEQRGIATERGYTKREIAVQNNLLRRILERLKKLKDWLKDVLTPKAPPTFADTLQGFLDIGEKNGL